jgi:pyruvate kinase
MWQVTGLLPVSAIVTYTTSGSSSLRASRERPTASILSMAAGVQTARRLTLAWGIHSVQVPAINTLDEMSAHACAAALREGFAVAGDTIVVAAGTPIGISGTTNTLKILRA